MTTKVDVVIPTLNAAPGLARTIANLGDGDHGLVFSITVCDGGSGDRVGCFESRVFGIGPQIGYIIPMGDLRGYLNLKAYGEFDNANRPDGWNVWLTFAISPAAPSEAPKAKPRITK